MAAASDAISDARYGFALATGFSFLLASGLVFNWFVEPARVRLMECELAEYAAPQKLNVLEKQPAFLKHFAPHDPGAFWLSAHSSGVS